eukprot:303391-Prymnesium_polylepis.2
MARGTSGEANLPKIHRWKKRYCWVKACNARRVRSWQPPIELHARWFHCTRGERIRAREMCGRVQVSAATWTRCRFTHSPHTDCAYKECQAVDPVVQP